MKRSPEDIALSYRSSEDARVRRNASIALGIVQTKLAVEALVKTMLLDSDKTVRDQAEKEILTLRPESSRHVMTILLSALTRPSSSTANPNISDDLTISDLDVVKVRAIGAINRLDRQGYGGELPRLSFLDRLSLGKVIEKSSAKNYASESTWRNWMPALLGSGIGCFLFVAYILAALGETDAQSVLQATAIIFFFVPFVAVWLIGNVINFRPQVDKRIAIMLELTRILTRFVSGWTILAAAIFLLVYRVGVENGPWFLLMWATGTSIVALSVLRLGTIVGRRFDNTGVPNRTLAILFGTLWSLLLVTGFALLFDANLESLFLHDPNQFGPLEIEDIRAIHMAMWPAMPPLLFGLSFAFVDADIRRARNSAAEEYPLSSKKITASWIRLVASWIVLGAAVLPFAYAAVPSEPLKNNATVLPIRPILVGKKGAIHDPKLAARSSRNVRFGSAILLEVKGEHRLTVEATPLAPDRDDVLINLSTKSTASSRSYISDDSKSTVREDSSVPPEEMEILSQSVSTGAYEVTIEKYEGGTFSASGRGVLNKLWEKMRRKLTNSSLPLKSNAFDAKVILSWTAMRTSSEQGSQETMTEEEETLDAIRNVLRNRN